MRDTVDIRRIALRDVRTYCGILLPSTLQRIPEVSRSIRRVEKEVRVPIEDLDAIYQHADRLKATVKHDE